MDPGIPVQPVALGSDMIDSRLSDEEPDDTIGEYDLENLVDLFRLLCKLKQKHIIAKTSFSFGWLRRVICKRQC
jgi:hypothetical protein